MCVTEVCKGGIRARKPPTSERAGADIRSHIALQDGLVDGGRRRSSTATAPHAGSSAPHVAGHPSSKATPFSLLLLLRNRPACRSRRDQHHRRLNLIIFFLVLVAPDLCSDESLTFLHFQGFLKFANALHCGRLTARL